MNILEYLDEILALVSILGGIAAAIGTAINARNQSKQISVDTKKTEALTGVEAVEKLSNVSVTLAQSLQSQLSDCTNRKLTIGQELEKIQIEIVELKIKIHRLVAKLRDILDSHNSIAKANNQLNCPGFPLINGLIVSVIEEIEKEIQIDD